MPHNIVFSLWLIPSAFAPALSSLLARSRYMFA